MAAKVKDNKTGEVEEINMNGVMAHDDLRARSVFKEMLHEDHAIGHKDWDLEEWTKIEKIK